MAVGKVLSKIKDLFPGLTTMHTDCEALIQIKVKTEPGCVVTALCEGKSITATEKNGFCFINPPAYGVWTLKGRVGSEATNTEVINVIEPTLYTTELATLRASINVAAPTGAKVTLAGASTQTAESIGGFATFAIPTKGAYTVSGEYLGCKSNTKTIEISGDGTQSVTLDFTSIELTGPAGATVLVYQGAERRTAAITSDAPVIVYLPKSGTWDVELTYDNLKNAKIGGVTLADYEKKAFSVLDNVCTLIMNTPPGVEAAVDNSKAPMDDHLYYDKQSAGQVTFYLPIVDTWNTQIRGQARPSSFGKVTFETLGQTIETTLDWVEIYGVNINMKNENADSGISYIEAARDHATGWEAWKSEPIFADIKPCIVKNGKVTKYLNRNDFTQDVDGQPVELTDPNQGDVMIEIPKIGYKFSRSRDNIEIRLVYTPGPIMPGYCYYPFSRDSEADCDKLYIGAYQGWLGTDSKLYSVSGKQITTRTSQDGTRKAAALKGAGYQQLDFFTLTLLQCLFLLVFKNGNPIGSFHEPPIGYREQQYAPRYTHATAGYMDKKPFCCGEFEKREQTHGVSQSDIVWRGVYNSKFLGVEGLWGAWDTHLDGFYLDAMSQKYKTTYKGFNNTGSGYLFSNPCGSLNPGILGFYGDVTGNNTGGLTPIKENVYPVEKSCPLGDEMFFNPKDNTDCTAYLPGIGKARGSANYQCFLFGLGHEESAQTYDAVCGRLVYKHLEK